MDSIVRLDAYSLIQFHMSTFVVKRKSFSFLSPFDFVGNLSFYSLT